jgi:hypothetical protein
MESKNMQSPIVRIAGRSRLRGVLCACSIAGALLATTGESSARGFTVIDSFCTSGGPQCPNGKGPTLLVPGPSGSLYGVTQGGGQFLEGAVVQLSRNGNGTWTQKILYNFCSRTNCSDGVQPLSIVVHGGDIFGTLEFGLKNHGGGIFELKPDKSSGTGWSETVLYSFDCPPAVEQNCLSNPLYLTVDADGDLFGTTMYAPRAPRNGVVFSGAVFELKPTTHGKWIFAPIYEFCQETDCADGASPAVLLVDPMSNIVYGTTAWGGVANTGTVFTLVPTARGRFRHEVIYTGGPRWSHPVNLIRGPSGTFFGTTVLGPGAPGTVYKLAKNAGTGKWQTTILYEFCKDGATCADGSVPIGLVADPAGNLYGAAAGGGINDGGLIYELANDNSQWSFTTLHKFRCNANEVCPDGEEPLDLIIMSGVVFGTAHSGGVLESTPGTIFSFAP